MKLIKQKFKIVDTITGGIKIVGHKKSLWYNMRSRYTVIKFYPKNLKTLQHFTDLFSDYPLPIGRSCTVYDSSVDMVSVYKISLGNIFNKQK
jgi:hypothetical protein